MSPLIANAQDKDSAIGTGSPSEGRREKMIQIMRARAAARRGSTSPSATAPSAAKANVKVTSDVAYGTDPLQRLDIYAPKTAKESLPVVFFLHGGGWSIGDKGRIADKGNVYPENGVIFISVNYRLAPKVMHPQQIQDTALAFSWVKNHVSEFGGDPNRLYLMGHSAGAQLVDLLATNDRYLIEKGLTLKDIKGVISLDTASLNLAERKAEDTREANIVGGMIDAAFGTDPKTLADASPTLAIHPGKQYPPFLMFCGEKRASCQVQHKKFSDALTKAGGQVSIKVVPLSHSEINQAAGQTDSSIFKDSLKFIKG
jgi:acetyl esterase/lipase